MIEKVTCSMNTDALRNTPVSAQESMLVITTFRNEINIELKLYKIAMRTIFVDQMHWSLPICTAEMKPWHAYCNINSSTILLVTSIPISFNNEIPPVKQGIFFYRVSVRDLSLTPVFPASSPLTISRVMDVICWSGRSNSLQNSTLLLIGVKEGSDSQVCILIETKRVQILGTATRMKVLCHTEHIALISLHTNIKDAAEELLPSGLYQIQCPYYEMIRISSDDHMSHELIVSHGVMLMKGFLVLAGQRCGRSVLSIQYLIAGTAPRLSMCAEIQLMFPFRESCVLIFDAYHSIFITDSNLESYLAKEARRVDLLSVLVCAIDDANTTRLKYIKSVLSLLTKTVTEGLHEAQIDRAASVAVANRLMSHTNNTVDNFNLALAKAQKLEEADIKQRQRILELEEERKGDDARLAQIVQKNKEMEKRAIDQLDTINAYKDAISKLQDTRDSKKELLIHQVQSAMNHISSVTHELQSVIEEIDDWS